VLRKCGGTVTNDVGYDVLKEDDELLLVKKLESFPLTIIRSAQNCEPSILSKYLLDLCSTFNRFYQHHRILIDDEGLKKARILLVDSIRQVIKNGLSILGLKAPERM
jgi:arginyl-tRNA synthetase